MKSLKYSFHRLSTFLGDRDSIRYERRKMKEIFFLPTLASTRHSNRVERAREETRLHACSTENGLSRSFARFLLPAFQGRENNH